MHRREFLVAAALSPWLLGAKRPRHTLVVHKSERRMELFVGKRLVERFDVALGGQPVGDKVRQGDSRTPEGDFYVAWKNPNSSFHRFLGLSYPMPRHAARARARGLISEAVEAKILARTNKRGIPPQLTPLGGYVGIHGGGAGADWTLGCIAITDAEIERLYRRLRRGDRVRVLP